MDDEIPRTSFPPEEGSGRVSNARFLGVVALLLLNAFFVAAEYGLVTARRTRILELEHGGNRRARAVLGIVQNPPRFIAAMQLGVTATSLAIGAIGEPVLARVLDPVLAGFAASRSRSC